MLIGVIGLFRLPDLYTKLHALSVIDTMGMILIMAGLIIQAGFSLIAIKLAFILLFVLFTTPIASHALAKSAYHGRRKTRAD